jgi:hypothetical protein
MTDRHFGKALTVRHHFFVNCFRVVGVSLPRRWDAGNLRASFSTANVLDRTYDMTAQPSPDNSKLAIVTGTTAGIGAEVATQLLSADGPSSAWRGERHSTTASATRTSPPISPMVSASRRIDEQVAPILRDGKRSRIGLVNNAASPDLLSVGERTDAEALHQCSRSIR